MYVCLDNNDMVRRQHMYVYICIPDPFYVGLNGLEIYDADSGAKIQFNADQLHATPFRCHYCYY